MQNATDGSFAMMMLCNEKHEAIYKSAKWSIKDTCQWLGEKEALNDDQISEMSKCIVAMRKAFKKQAKAELVAELEK
jgi:hypothetical protein